MYMPATIGFSALLAVSSSTMEARVTTSFGVNPAASAKRSLSLFQNMVFSFCMRFMKSSRLVFQYTSYVLGMNRQAIVAVS